MRPGKAPRTREQMQADYLAATPSLYRGMVERAFAGELSPRAAIKAKCLGCTGHVRADVAGCTAVLCELHPLRPYQPRRQDAASDLEATQSAGEV